MTKRNIVHIEIPAADSAQAGEFYKALFGWDIQHIPEMNYTMWDAGDGSSGGFTQLGPEVKPGEVVLYINSDDIEADLQKAVLLGATIIRPKTEIPNNGWFGMFKDLTGNVIGLHTSKDTEFNK
jgi:predicted enzyme related to lactoylglutathione lyase